MILHFSHMGFTHWDALSWFILLRVALVEFVIT